MRLVSLSGCTHGRQAPPWAHCAMACLYNMSQPGRLRLSNPAVVVVCARGVTVCARRRPRDGFGYGKRNYEACLLKLSDMLTEASIPPVTSNVSLLSHEQCVPPLPCSLRLSARLSCQAKVGGVQVVENDGRNCEQKERNMKSKTAGKFHARRLDEKKKTSDKKDSRRRPVQ